MNGHLPRLTMFLFYAKTDSNNSLILDGDEMRHATKTLRKRVGDEIWCTDGLGNKYKASISGISKQDVSLDVSESVKIEKTVQQLHIAMALTKNASRFEWFLEKATEIGISSITPIITTRTEKKSFKHERGAKIVLAAMKQSLRCYLPILNEAISLKSFLTQEPEMDQHRLIANYKASNAQLSNTIKQRANTSILIGPEGDFTEEELQLADQAGFTSINLGNHRLRTETAGIVACHTFNLINNV